MPPTNTNATSLIIAGVDVPDSRIDDTAHILRSYGLEVHIPARSDVGCNLTNGAILVHLQRCAERSEFVVELSGKDGGKVRFGKQVADVRHINQILSERLSLREPNFTRRAVIDIGSQTAKLKIFDIFTEGARLFHEEKSSTSIIEGVQKYGEISPINVDSLCNLIDTWLAKAKSKQCEDIAICATAAFRSARNAPSVIERVRSETKCLITILDQEAEARAIRAALSDELQRNDAVALNLGGGSVQLVSHDSSFLVDKGVRSIIAEHPWHEPLSDESYGAVKGMVRQWFSNASRVLPRFTTVFHTGGELQFLLRTDAKLETCLDQPRHFAEISVRDMSIFSDNMRKMPISSVHSSSQLDGAWLAGAIASNEIAIAAAEATGATRLIPSNINITDGLLSGSVLSYVRI